jgi:phytoene desaturase
VVVVNADLPTAYRELLPAGHAPRRLRWLRYSPSAVVLHAGTRKRPDDASDTAAHHTITFGAAWDRTFTEIIDRNELMSDPSFLLTTPTRTDASLAPPDRDAHYVLFPTPHLAHRDPIAWRTEGPRYRDRMLETLAARGYPGFADSIEVEHLVTPAAWAAQGMAAGAPFAAAHLFRQTGPFRPPTLDRHVGNLVFCGSNTQPGVGVPMVVISGRLAAARVTG